MSSLFKQHVLQNYTQTLEVNTMDQSGATTKEKQEFKSEYTERG